MQEPEDAMQIFAVRRFPLNMSPSEIRYLHYFTKIVQAEAPIIRTVNLKSLTCSPVPRVTKARDGCRLFIDVANHERVVWSSPHEESGLRLYYASEGKITTRCGVSLTGDITVALYHARNTFGGMGRPQNIKICQFQLHTGFITENETLIHFDRSEMDDLLDDEHIPKNFNISIPIEVTENPNQNTPWLNESNRSQRNPIILFSTQAEYQEMVDNFSKFHQN